MSLPLWMATESLRNSNSFSVDRHAITSVSFLPMPRTQFKLSLFHNPIVLIAPKQTPVLVRALNTWFSCRLPLCSAPAVRIVDVMRTTCDVYLPVCRALVLHAFQTVIHMTMADTWRHLLAFHHLIPVKSGASFEAGIRAWQSLRHVVIYSWLPHDVTPWSLRLQDRSLYHEHQLNFPIEHVRGSYSQANDSFWGINKKPIIWVWCLRCYSKRAFIPRTIKAPMDDSAKITIQPFGDSTIRRFNHSIIWRISLCDNLAIRRFHYSIIQQINHSTIPPFQ